MTWRLSKSIRAICVICGQRTVTMRSSPLSRGPAREIRDHSDARHCDSRFSILNSQFSTEGVAPRWERPALIESGENLAPPAEPANPVSRSPSPTVLSSAPPPSAPPTSALTEALPASAAPTRPWPHRDPIRGHGGYPGANPGFRQSSPAEEWLAGGVSFRRLRESRPCASIRGCRLDRSGLERSMRGKGGPRTECMAHRHSINACVFCTRSMKSRR